jgi:DNA-binding response OmpR family regulator
MSPFITSILNDSNRNEIDGGEAGTGKTVPRNSMRILLVDIDQAFCERLAQELTADGYEVLMAETGRRAFTLLRNWRNPIAWLYTRAVLDSLIDGQVLADEYHSTHPERPVIFASSAALSPTSRDIVLKDPAPVEVANAIRHAIRVAQPSILANSDAHSDAA